MMESLIVLIFLGAIIIYLFMRIKQDTIDIELLRTQLETQDKIQACLMSHNDKINELILKRLNDLENKVGVNHG